MAKTKVLFVAAELTPLAKVGGLADVIGALPKSLRKKGADSRIVIPKYGIIDEKKYPLKLVADNIEVPFNGQKEKIRIFASLLPGSDVIVYLIDHLKYLGAGGVYFEKDASSGGASRECQRFTFFARCIQEIFSPLNFWPDIIHCHDWHVGIVPFLLKERAKKDKLFPKMKILLTIHNIAYQGKYNYDEATAYLNLKKAEGPVMKHDKNNPVTIDYSFLGKYSYDEATKYLNLKGDKNLEEKLKKYDSVTIDYLQQAIAYADLLNTVSPTYAKEILTPAYGEGLEKYLLARKNDLSGIVNGIDTEIFNPKTDPNLAKNYSAVNPSGKIEDKKDLQKITGLAIDENIPVLGVVGRLADQKGLDLLIPVLPDLVKRNIQLVILGSGLSKYEEIAQKMAADFPKNVFTKIGFDASLAQKIYAGSDLFLMPSRFEPCGLGQLIAMRYGTIPVVRKTGGLKDTVEEFNPKSGRGTGFLFKNFDAKELLAAIEKSLKIYQNKRAWRKLVKNAMNQNFSWDRSGQEYLKLYKKLYH
ncbi:MAG: glycogen/starch synthase [Patescibacteria group bacterium]